VYALLDLARDPQIQRILYQNPGRFSCIESAPLSAAVREVAPYILRLREGQGTTSEILRSGWGNSWGVFVVTPVGLAMEELRRQLHGLLRVQDELGGRYVFRFYDPRVLRVFLPSCGLDQLRQFFGPVREYWMEDDAGAAFVGFTVERGSIVRRTVSLTGGRHPEEEGRVLPPLESTVARRGA
jgi:hypothetical protein